MKRFLTPKSYVLKILENRYASEHSIAGMQRLNPADEAHQVFATIVRLVGEKSVIQAGEVLLKAQKNERGLLVTPITCQSPFIIDVATASDPFWEFGALVTSYDDRGYAVGCCLGNFWRTMWQDAQDKFSSYVSKYGEKAIISAAAKIRSARKMGDGTLSDPSGNAPQPPKVWLGQDKLNSLLRRTRKAH